MKASLALLTIACFATPSVHAAPAPGLYAWSHEISFTGDYSARDCRENQGRWVNGYCRVPASDYVVLEKKPEGFLVSVDTITTNGHTCALKGTAVQRGDDLIAVSGAGEGCRLALRAEGNGLSVARIEQAACEALCASTTGLEISHARKLR